MSWNLVGQGNVLAVADLAQYEGQLKEGSRNMLELALRLPVTDGVAQTLEDALKSAGVTDVRVVNYQNPHIRIYFTKGFPWLAVIAGVIVLSLVIAALVISWKLFTYIGEVSPVGIPLLALAAISGATVVGIYLVKRRT